MRHQTAHVLRYPLAEQPHSAFRSVEGQHAIEMHREKGDALGAFVRRFRRLARQVARDVPNQPRTRQRPAPDHQPRAAGHRQHLTS